VMRRACAFMGRGAAASMIGEIGINGGSDTIQAAVLMEKNWKFFPEEILARRAHRAQLFGGDRRFVATIPKSRRDQPRCGATIYDPPCAGRRDASRTALRAKAFPTAIHYPIPLHRQTALPALPDRRRPRAGERTGWREVISLPITPIRRDDPGPDHRRRARALGWVRAHEPIVHMSPWRAALQGRTNIMGIDSRETSRRQHRGTTMIEASSRALDGVSRVTGLSAKSCWRPCASRTGCGRLFVR